MSTVPGIFDLTGHGIGVTGGGGHLGSAMSLGLAQAGATVVVCGRREGPLDALREKARAEQVSGRIIPVVADITDDEAVAVVLQRIETEAGRVSGWINNAYGGTGGLLLDATPDDLRRTVESGLTRVMTLTSMVAGRMIEGGGGSIVNVASMYGMVSPHPEVYRDHSRFHNPPAYGAAKAGLIQFTRYAACHLAAKGIRVNAISPGPFPSDAVARETSFVDELSRQVPMGRIGAPHELAGAAVFLLSSASSYVTGHNLVVDGGWTAW